MFQSNDWVSDDDLIDLDKAKAPDYKNQRSGISFSQIVNSQYSQNKHNTNKSAALSLQFSQNSSASSEKCKNKQKILSLLSHSQSCGEPSPTKESQTLKDNTQLTSKKSESKKDKILSLLTNDTQSTFVSSTRNNEKEQENSSTNHNTDLQLNLNVPDTIPLSNTPSLEIQPSNSLKRKQIDDSSENNASSSKRICEIPLEENSPKNDETSNNLISKVASNFENNNPIVTKPSGSNSSKRNVLLNVFNNSVPDQKDKHIKPVQNKKTVNFNLQVEERWYERNETENADINALKLKKLPKKSSKKRKVVVRQFPGPAGLLPDDDDDSAIVDITSSFDDENSKSGNETSIDNLYSQTTKSLFTTGPWQKLMDDLPADFEIYNIATLKENATKFKEERRKIPYFAAMINHIDYSSIDPRVVLKDISGVIEGVIQHVILKQYPSAFGIGVVILLKDLQFLITTKKTICLIISKKNLVSMYQDEERTVETELFEEINKLVPNIDEDLRME